MKLQLSRGAEKASQVNAPEQADEALNSSSGGGEASVAGPIRSIMTFGVGKAVPGIVALASVPLWVAVFGAANYALYSIYWATSLIATSLLTGWARQAILRFTGANGMEYESAPRGVRLLLEASPVLGVVPIAALSVSTLGVTGDGMTFVVVVALGLACQSRYAMSQALLQRDGRSGRYALAEIVRSVGTLVASMIIAFLGLITPWAIPAAASIATAVALSIATLKSSSMPSQRSSSRGGEMLRDYWRFGWPLSIWLTVSACLIYVDRFVVTALFGLERAGHYAAAADIVIRGMGLIVAPVIMFLHPTFMRAWNTEGRQGALRTWKRMTVWLSVACAAAATVAFLLYLPLGDVLLEEPVSPAVFGILACSGAAWQLALMLHKPLEASGRTSLMLYILLGSVLMTLALNAALASPLAELGVAVASAGGAFVYITSVSVANLKVLSAALSGQEESKL